jgi:hypothetical protein
MTTGQNDRISRFYLKLLEANHAVKGKRRRHSGSGSLTNFRPTAITKEEFRCKRAQQGLSPSYAKCRLLSSRKFPSSSLCPVATFSLDPPQMNRDIALSKEVWCQRSYCTPSATRHCSLLTCVRLEQKNEETRAIKEALQLLLVHTYSTSLI